MPETLLDSLRSRGFLVLYDRDRSRITIEPDDLLTDADKQAIRAAAKGPMVVQLLWEMHAADAFSNWMLSLPDPFADGVGVSPSRLDALAKAVRDREQLRRELREREAAAERERKAKVKEERKKDRRKREKAADIGRLFQE